MTAAGPGIVVAEAAARVGRRGEMGRPARDQLREQPGRQPYR